MTHTCLVSVVIPAHNALTTIDETLRSVRSQSHERLEIIVVDDGSTDDTVVVAQQHAAQDARIRIIKQDNAGVAAARNRGWQSAQADFIAFIDADDLWGPTNIERQLKVMIAEGEKTGLVYSWFMVIDAESRMLNKTSPCFHTGDVLDELFARNFIGNGSSVMVRREALLAADGFDSRLRTAGAQGCEDLLFYCRVAETYHFAVVPEYLIGYRYLPENMSSNMPRMLRSWMLFADAMAARHPDRTQRLKVGLRNYSVWLLRKALAGRKLGHFATCLALMVRRDPLLAAKVLAFKLPLDILVVMRWRFEARLRRWRRGFQEPSSCFRIGELEGHNPTRLIACRR
jgi:glycosyltransferase involved in cell wall biosynthesis